MFDERLNLYTSLDPDEAALKLSQAMESHPSKPGYSLAGYAFDNLGRFGGDVNREGFKIQRRSLLSQTWWLVVQGEFKPAREGSKVNVRLSLHPGVKVFALFWYAIVLYVLVASIIRLIRSGSTEGGVWFALLMGIAMYVQTLFIWASEKLKAQRFLSALYDS